MFGFSMIRLIIYGICIAAVVGGAFAIRWHYISIGEQRCQIKVERAIQQQQKIAYENADILSAQTVKIRTIIKKIPTPEVSHVPNDVSCNWNDATQRMFNDSINQANSAAKSGKSLP